MTSAKEIPAETIEDALALLCANMEMCARVILVRTRDKGVADEATQMLRNVRKARAILGKVWRQIDKEEER